MAKRALHLVVDDDGADWGGIRKVPGGVVLLLPDKRTKKDVEVTLKPREVKMLRGLLKSFVRELKRGG